MTTIWRWSARLARPIVLKDGTRLVTLGDVRMFILKQSEHIQDRSSWHQAAELVILAAEHGGTSMPRPLRWKTRCFWKRGTRVGGNDVRWRACPEWPRHPVAPSSPRRWQ
jgi:hypothetical protein